MKSFAKFVKEQILGLYENITIQHVGNVRAKVDTGNGGYNVLHGVDVQEKDDKVTFKTVNDKVLTLPIVDHATIHIGSGVKEARPVVRLDCSLGSKQFNGVKFSIGDRSENEVPVLLSEDFIKINGGVVNLNVNDSPKNL
jgi:hypothetical protein